MITKGNFSGNAQACYDMGEDAFKKAHRGKYNGDINELWKEIVSKAEVKPKTTTKK